MAEVEQAVQFAEASPEPALEDSVRGHLRGLSHSGGQSGRGRDMR